MSEWFSEHCPMWDGMALSVEITQKLLEQHSKFQKIEVFQTKTYGNMLVLDGKIQCTERDEFAYHEMLVHPALYAHPNPKSVLVIGGGDGGCVREILKHLSVEHVDLCEIDEAVSEVAYQFLPHMMVGMKDPRVHLHYADGIDFIRQSAQKYDVIIIDSSDPIGPAEVLFGAPFYGELSTHLTPHGITAAQSEFFFIHQPAVKALRSAIKTHFENYQYLFVHVPSYPGGGVGVALATHDQALNLLAPSRAIDIANHRYYTPEIHAAAAVLPAFAREVNA